MNKISNILVGSAALLLLGSLSGCIEETFPTSGYMTTEQVEKQPEALEGFVNGITGLMATTGSYMGSSVSIIDCGYPSFIMMRDACCSDFLIYNYYDGFYYWAANMYLGGNYTTAKFPWVFYYKLINCANNILTLEVGESGKPYVGMAHFWRAYFYFELARYYEYKPTGVAKLDNKAVNNGIDGLTVPLITETSTEDDARNTPRLKFYDMYRFLLDDLAKAQECLAGYSRSSKKNPDLGVVYGEMARIYLDMATRFQRNAEHLAQYHASGVDLGVSTAAECYAKAAEYAAKAIEESGARPLTKEEYYGGSNYGSGFNSMSLDAWMLGLPINKELLWCDWLNYISLMSPETHYGLAGIIDNGDGTYDNTYQAQRKISASLYSKIPNSDWRKKTWIDPDDAGDAANVSKYPTAVAAEHFAQIPAYAGIKFRPKDYDGTEYTVGAAVDVPLMRVEEMYLIEAEALAAGGSNLEAGKSALNSFVRTYRDASYNSTASDIDGFIDDLMIQKRIEFWGEGIVFWDYKRLSLQVVRGYEGTNVAYDYYKINSIEGYCAPWMNFYIPTSELEINEAMTGKGNPDPSGAIAQWSE